MIIADASDPSRPAPATSLPESDPTARILAALACAVGIAAATVYFRAGLALSHYDAKGHLVVARRVIDSLTPGWVQIGAVWLPLPHLLNLLPVQIDFFYRTGLSAIAISVASFTVATYAAARLVLLATGSRLGATTAAAVLALNPNLLYLQSTPMTEPLLLALTLLSVLRLYEWVTRGQPEVPRATGWVLAAAWLTRYEAWPVTLAALVASAWAWWRRGLPAGQTLRLVGRLALYPGAALAAFLLQSRASVGEWFVSSGFFVPDPLLLGRPLRTALALWWGTHRLSGYGIAVIALATLVVMTVAALARRARAAWLLPLALVGAGALPFAAFVDGHPFRIRYMVPLVAAAALYAGLAVGLAKRASWLLAAALAISIAIEAPPFDRGAAMIEEAQWDRPASAGRAAVTSCLVAGWDHDTIMASMGSLAHYMQELSAAGFRIADFLHEGNGDIWLAALADGPAPHVNWVLIEEQAEGGDQLAMRARANPRFLAGFARVCEGGGVALYRRMAALPSR